MILEANEQEKGRHAKWLAFIGGVHQFGRIPKERASTEKYNAPLAIVYLYSEV